MKITKSVETIIYAVLPLVVVTILFAFAAPYGISKVTEVRAKITQATTSGNILSQKLNVLSNISASTTSQSDIVATALPISNPSLVTISQIKVLASASALVLSNIKAGGELKDKTGLSRVDISFDVTGPRAAILSFLSSVNTISPITTLGRIKLNESAGAVISNVTVRSFWAPLPTKLPAITDPESDLTADEKSTLIKIAALKQPIFSDVPASEVLGRSDPFSP